jgi:hypothetical protein
LRTAFLSNGALHDMRSKFRREIRGKATFFAACNYYTYLARKPD